MSQLIASVLLVGITITAGTVLWAFRPNLPAAPTRIYYQLSGNQTEPAWGDGSDCQNVNGVQQCDLLPAFDIVFTAQSPGTMLLTNLQFLFLCNGTVYLQANLVQIEWVPGTPSTPGGNAPQLGRCGNYVPPQAAFNRFAFFQQLIPGSTTLQDGDQVVVYAHTFTAFVDDDFHGAPKQCYTVPGLCTIVLAYTGAPSADLLQIPLLGIAT